MKYPVGIDIDGVVADFVGGWTRAYAYEWPNRGVTAESVQAWDFLPVTHFGTWGHFWHWVRVNHIFALLPTYPNATRALGYIQEAGVSFVFITGRPMWAEEETLTWLDGLGFGDVPVHFNGNKGQVKCSVYVEDAPQYLAHLVGTRPDATIYRMVRPWNQPMPGTLDITGWDILTARRIIRAARTYPGNLGGDHENP